MSDSREIFRITLGPHGDYLHVEAIEGPKQQLARDQIMGISLLLEGRYSGSLLNLYDEVHIALPTQTQPRKTESVPP